MAKKLKRQYIYILALAVAAVLALGTYIAINEYNYIFAKAILKDGTVKVYPNMSFDEVVDQLHKEGFIESPHKMSKFAYVFEKDTALVGNYQLRSGESYRTLLNTLSNGRQTPIRVTFNNIRSVDKLATTVSKYILADSDQMLALLKSDSVIAAYGFEKPTFISMFIPNTYEVYWTITPQEFLDKMHSEYKRFWTATRNLKAERLGFTPLEVSTIASIVIEETKAEAEMSDVAGVYINRIRKGMPLQADPTVKFALNDPSIRRILYKHLKVDSPYNTYINAGLPPGAICMPPIVAIDAVLNYEGHDYYYFCAKADFSGRHAFAKTLSEHSKNAAAYSAELNRRKIR